jgi:uncharacterized protein (DUF305 family)
MSFSTRGSRSTAAAAAAGLLLLAACSSTPSSTTPMNTASGMGMSAASSPSAGASQSTTGTAATGTHNNADVAFSTNMIPHHAQAVAMAGLAAVHATSAAVKDLAVKIKAAQAPEIAAMSGWLAGWGAKVPAATYATGSMGSMTNGSMPGMMSDADMTALGRASGTAFDRMWLTMMISHHEGAIAMAKTELGQGQNTESKKLAQSIITGQSAEIVTMKSLLATLPS